MSIGRKINVPLPPNGHDLSEIVAKELEKNLKQYFRIALSYPNAIVKIQWSANFYSAPYHLEDSQLFIVAEEGKTITDLAEEGLEPEMIMDSIEVGVATASSPAITRPGISSNSLPPAPTESRGRRDVQARRGRGIDRVAGQFVDPSLNNVGDQSRVVAGMRSEVADLEQGKEEPLHESAILVGEEVEGGGDVNSIS